MAKKESHSPMQRAAATTNPRERESERRRIISVYCA
jgi:hypothetical protein